MKYTKRLNSRNRHIAPSLISTGIGMASGLIGGIQAKREQKRTEEEAIRQMFLQKEVTDSTALANYDTYGTNVELYQNGGLISTKGRNNQTKAKPIVQQGGDLIPIGDNAVEVDGNTHGENTIDNSYGVTLQDPLTGEPVAEVEDDEVIINDYVFSNRLTDEKGVPFAKRAKKLVKKRTSLESDLDDTNDTKNRNSIERQLAGINMAENRLIERQEIIKAIEGDEILAEETGSLENPIIESDLDIPIMKKGGKLPKYLNGGRRTGLGYMGELDDSDLPPGSPYLVPEGGYTSSINTSNTNSISDNQRTSAGILPFVDNISNALLTATTPTLSTPIMSSRQPLETRVDVSPQVRTIKSGTNRASDFISRNSSNSAVARAGIANTRLRGAEALSDVYSQQSNIETGLRNQEIDASNQYRFAAANMTNQQQDREFARRTGIQGRVSANFANLSEDFKQIKSNELRDDYYDQELLLSILNDPTISNEDKEGEYQRFIRRNPGLLRTNRARRALNI